MINTQLVQDAFSPLIGYRRGLDHRDSDIDDDLKTSLSGTYVDDIHPLFNATNLEATMDENLNFTTLRNYDDAVNYKKWDVVRLHDSNIYYSLQDNNLNNDVTDALFWKPTTLFSHHLRLKRNGSITNLINGVRNNGKIAGNKEVLQNTLLYYGSGKHEKEKYGRFVGQMFTLQKADLSMRIPRIILEFTQAQTIPIYVFHSTSTVAVASYNLAYTNAGRQQSFLLDSELFLTFQNNNIGGHYLIGYFESDLTTNNKAIYTDDLPFGGNCGTCSNRNAQAYLHYQPYVDVQSIQVDSDFITNKPNQTWGDEDIVETSAQSWGLNFAFTIACDLTEVYIYNKDLFVNALSAQIKLDFLTTIAHNTRNKGLADMIRSQAFAELKSEQNPYKELAAAIKAVTLDMSGLNPICLPCIEKKKDFKFGTVWA